MKFKYLSLLFAAMMLSFCMASCSDDEEEIPASWYGNFGYLEYEVYPQNNVTPAVAATHDARGLHVTEMFRPFTVKLRRAVDTDTEFKVGIVAGEGENAMPENALRFLPQSAAGEESGDKIIIPAGKTEVKVKVLVGETEFAHANKDAATYTATVSITEISNSEVMISKNRNSVIYSLAVGAYLPNKVGLESLAGTDTSSQKAGTADDLQEYWGDMQVKLAYPSDKDVTVGFAIDWEQMPAAAECIPEDAVQFEADGKKLDKLEVVVKAGQTAANVRCKLLKRDFVKGGTYAMPLHITSVAGDEVVTRTEPFFFQIETVALSFEESTLGKVDPYSNYRYSSFSHTIQNEISKVCDGDTWSYIFISGYPGVDLVIDMREEKEVSGFMMQGYGAWTSYAMKRVDIKISEDGQAWTMLYHIDEDLPKNGGTQYISFAPVKTRYIMLDIKNSYNAGLTFLAEVGVYVK